jgi:hypothetical protein
VEASGVVSLSGHCDAASASRHSIRHISGSLGDL